MEGVEPRACAVGVGGGAGPEEEGKLLVPSAASAAATHYSPYSPTGGRGAASRRSRYVIASMIALLGAGAGVQVFLRRTVLAFANYRNFALQSSLVAYVGVAAAVVIFKLVFTHDISPEMRSVRLLPRFFVLGALDAVHDFLLVVASGRTSLAYTTLLPQATLPLTMLAARGLMRVRFAPAQVAAATAVLAGVAVLCVPSFVGGGGGDGGALWNWLLVLACVPAAISALLKQATMTSARTDVFYLGLCVGVFQLAVGLCVAPALDLMPGAGALGSFAADFSGG